jgi:hypothetical protein
MSWEELRGTPLETFSYREKMDPSIRTIRFRPIWRVALIYLRWRQSLLQFCFKRSFKVFLGLLTPYEQDPESMRLNIPRRTSRRSRPEKSQSPWDRPSRTCEMHYKVQRLPCAGHLLTQKGKVQRRRLEKMIQLWWFGSSVLICMLCNIAISKEDDLLS